MKKFFRKKKGSTPQPSPQLNRAEKGGPSAIAGYEVREKDLGKLHKAAWHADLGKVRQLAKKEVNGLDKENRTPLHLACVKGHWQVVQELLEWKAKTNLGDNDGRTPLIKAVMCGHYDCARHLLESKADPNAKDRLGWASIHYAVQNDSLDLVELLLQSNNTDIEIMNSEGNNPLHMSVGGNKTNMMKFLLTEGADPDMPNQTDYRTALMMACQAGHAHLITPLLEYKADISLKDKDGWTAEDVARTSGHEQCRDLVRPKTPGRGSARGKGGPGKNTPGAPHAPKQDSFGAPALDRGEDVSEADATLSKSEGLPHGDSWADTDDESEMEFTKKKAKSPRPTADDIPEEQEEEQKPKLPSLDISKRLKEENEDASHNQEDQGKSKIPTLTNGKTGSPKTSNKTDGEQSSPKTFKPESPSQIPRLKLQSPKQQSKDKAPLSARSSTSVKSGISVGDDNTWSDNESLFSSAREPKDKKANLLQKQEQEEASRKESMWSDDDSLPIDSARGEKPATKDTPPPLPQQGPPQPTPPTKHKTSVSSFNKDTHGTSQDVFDKAAAKQQAMMQELGISDVSSVSSMDMSDDEMQNLQRKYAGPSQVLSTVDEGGSDWDASERTQSKPKTVVSQKSGTAKPASSKPKDGADSDWDTTVASDYNTPRAGQKVPLSARSLSVRSEWDSDPEDVEPQKPALSSFKPSPRAVENDWDSDTECALAPPPSRNVDDGEDDDAHKKDTPCDDRNLSDEKEEVLSDDAQQEIVPASSGGTKTLNLTKPLSPRQTALSKRSPTEKLKSSKSQQVSAAPSSPKFKGSMNPVESDDEYEEESKLSQGKKEDKENLDKREKGLTGQQQKDKAERDRLEKATAEKERLNKAEMERIKKEMLEKDNKNKADKERLTKELQEKEKQSLAEKERLAKELQEKQKQNQAEREKLAKELEEKEKQSKVEKEKFTKEMQEREQQIIAERDKFKRELEEKEKQIRAEKDHLAKELKEQEQHIQLEKETLAKKLQESENHEKQAITEKEHLIQQLQEEVQKSKEEKDRLVQQMMEKEKDPQEAQQRWQKENSEKEHLSQQLKELKEREQKEREEKENLAKTLKERMERETQEEKARMKEKQEEEERTKREEQEREQKREQEKENLMKEYEEKMNRKVMEAVQQEKDQAKRELLQKQAEAGQMKDQEMELLTLQDKAKKEREELEKKHEEQLQRHKQELEEIQQKLKQETDKKKKHEEMEAREREMVLEIEKLKKEKATVIPNREHIGRTHDDTHHLRRERGGRDIMDGRHMANNSLDLDDTFDGHGAPSLNGTWEDDGLSYSSTEADDLQNPAALGNQPNFMHGNDSTNMVRLQDQLREAKRVVERERSAKISLENKRKNLEHEKAELIEKLEELARVKSGLEQNKIDLESKNRSNEYRLHEEMEKNKSLEVLLNKTKEQLSRKEEKFTEEIEQKQKAELQLRNIQMELRSTMNAIKQLEAEKEDLTRQLNHEKNQRQLQEQINEEQLKIQSVMRNESNKTTSSQAEAISKLEAADETRKQAITNVEKLQTELYAAKLELERQRSRYKDDHGMLTTENEELQSKLDEFKADIKLNEEALAHATMQYNIHMSQLKTENAMLQSGLDKERAGIEKLEAELESFKNRLDSASAELDKAHTARSELERHSFKEREEWGRMIERKDDELSRLKESNQTLSHNLGTLEGKVGTIDHELSISNATLHERTSQLSTIQRELDQKKAAHDIIDDNLRKLKEDHVRLQAKSETMEERMANLQHDKLSLQQQLDEEKKRGFERETSKVQDKDQLSVVLNTLQNDHDKTRKAYEEKNNALNETVSRLREELRMVDSRKSSLEQELKHQQNEFTDIQRRLQIADAAMELANKTREQQDRERHTLRQEVERLTAKLETAKEKQTESQTRVAELTDRLEKAEHGVVATTERLASQSATAEAVAKSKADAESIAHRLEVENARLQTEIKHKNETIEHLQRDVGEASKVRGTMETVLSDLKSNNVHLETKLHESTATKIMSQQEAEDNQNLWENEVKARSKLGLKISQLERAKQEAQSQVDEEKRKLRKAVDQKRAAESKLEGEVAKNRQLEKEILQLKTTLKAARKRLKELDTSENRVSALHADFDKERMNLEATLSTTRRQLDEAQHQLQNEQDEKDRLQSETGQLQAELRSYQGVQKNVNKLQRTNQKLEDEFMRYKSHVNNGYVERGEIDRIRNELEAKSRMELNQKLEEVNAYLEEQAKAREKLDSIRQSNESQLRQDFEKAKKELLDEMERMRNNYQDTVTQKTSQEQEIQRLKDMYDNETKLREKLAAKLQKSNEKLLSAKTQQVYASPAQLANSMPMQNNWTGPQGSPMGPGKFAGTYGANESLSKQLRAELDRSILKHLEKGPQVELAAIPHSTNDPLGQASFSKSSSEYMNVLKRNYLL